MTETQGARTVAAGTDDQLAAAPARNEESVGTRRELRAEEVGTLRRDAVEAVMRSAAQLGWQTAKVGFVERPRWHVYWRTNGKLAIEVSEESWEQQNMESAVRAMLLISPEMDPAEARRELEEEIRRMDGDGPDAGVAV